MKNFFRKLSLMPQGLRYKLLISFCLMSIIPLLVLGLFFSSFVLVEEEMTVQRASVMILVSILIAWLGLVLAKRLIDPVIDMSIEARIIASGEFDKRIRIDTEDEIGELGRAINLLTRRIKDNIHELRDYGEKTKEINLEIQNKVLALSNILQIGDLISASVDLDNILDLVLDKVSQLFDRGWGCVFLSKDDPNEFSVRAFQNLENNELVKLKFRKGQGFLGEVIRKNAPAVIDTSTEEGREGSEFSSQYHLENALAVPLSAAKQVRGLLITGNFIKNFRYTDEDVDLVKVFTKQLSIAVENDALIKKAEKLAVKDELTGLFNAKFMREALEDEIKRASIYQRPCSFILYSVHDFERYRTQRGELAAESALRKVADVLRKYSSPIGRAGRMTADSFSLILPEKNKKEAMGIASRATEEISAISLSEDRDDRIAVSAGVSENPIDGSSGNDIFEKAAHNIEEALSKGKNTVIG